MNYGEEILIIARECLTQLRRTDDSKSSPGNPLAVEMIRDRYQGTPYIMHIRGIGNHNGVYWCNRFYFGKKFNKGATVKNDETNAKTVTKKEKRQRTLILKSGNDELLLWQS